MELVANESAVFIMTVFRREVFETVGGFDEAQWASEDYDLWLRAALAGFVFRRNPQPLGWYRVRGNSLSRNRARMLRGILHTFRKARPHFPAASEALRVLDAQVARFESELLLEEAKSALEHGECAQAAERLRALQARGGGSAIAVTAWLAEHWPQAAVFAYRARTWRPSWLRSRNVAAEPGVAA
jgi:GT2 family glycosyltransferase